MQKPSGTSVAKWAAVGGLAALAIYGGSLAVRMVPAADNPGIHDADFYVVQDWKGRETANGAHDNFSSEIKIFGSSGQTKTYVEGFGFYSNDYKSTTTAPSSPLGTMDIEDHGIGESMVAKNVNGTIVAAWQEQVQRGSLGPLFSGVFDMRGTLQGSIGGKTMVVMPENIPVIGDHYDVRVGTVDENGSMNHATESIGKRPFGGWMFGDQRDSTTIQSLKLVDGQSAIDNVFSISEHNWFLRDYPWAPETSVVKDSEGNVLYSVEGVYWDQNPRTPFDGYNILGKDGKMIAKIDIVDPDNVRQLEYKFSVDNDGDGSLEDVATFYFNAREREIGDDTGIYHWVGELWAKTPGSTADEKIDNLKRADAVMKLLHDTVPVDNDGDMFNIEEYMDFILLLKDTQENGFAKPERLANAATAVDTLDYEKALDMLVGKK